MKKMNKHQEALNTISRFIEQWADCTEEINVVQELVDSKKPVKPTMLPYKGFDGEVASYQGCPNCTIPITNVFTSREYKPKFCQECGREFDWSKDE